jgi:hypothetical protein
MPKISPTDEPVLRREQAALAHGVQIAERTVGSTDTAQDAGDLAHVAKRMSEIELCGAILGLVPRADLPSRLREVGEAHGSVNRLTARHHGLDRFRVERDLHGDDTGSVFGHANRDGRVHLATGGDQHDAERDQPEAR